MKLLFDVNIFSEQRISKRANYSHLFSSFTSDENLVHIPQSCVSLVPLFERKTSEFMNNVVQNLDEIVQKLSEIVQN